LQQALLLQRAVDSLGTLVFLALVSLVALGMSLVAFYLDSGAPRVASHLDLEALYQI
jgi:hypothetical protein